MSQHPDVAIVRKCDDLTLLPVEVAIVSKCDDLTLLHVGEHSSPFDITIKKCMLGVMDLLRLHRAHDRDVSRCCGFVFPNLPGERSSNNQCVVKVEVKWENLKFLFIFTPFKDISSAECAISDELRNAIKHSPRPGSPLNELQEYVIHLSDKDLEMFGEGTMHVPSRRSILIRSKDNFFKHPVNSTEQIVLLDIALTQSKKHLPHLIKLGGSHFPNGLIYFEYVAIPHNHLSVEEAKKCLGNLVGQLVQVIKDLHFAGWGHQDIHLSNICFNDSFEPIFVDLDRCRLKDD